MTNDASQWLLALERERDELGDLRYRYSALYSAVRFLLEEERGIPMTATNDAKVRNVLNEVVTNGEWTNGEQCGDWKISKAVYEMAVEARDMLDMTKLSTDDEMAERKTLASNEGTRRAPHMERYVTVGNCHGEGWQPILTVGNQSFRVGLPDVDKEGAEWMRDMLCIALDNLVKSASTPSPASSSVEQDLAMMLRRFIWDARKQTGDASAKVLAGKASELLVRLGLEGSPLREDTEPSPHGAASSSEIAEIKARHEVDEKLFQSSPPISWGREIHKDRGVLLSKLAELEGKAP
jgi:hypothetical protein